MRSYRRIIFVTGTLLLVFFLSFSRSNIDVHSNYSKIADYSGTNSLFIEYVVHPPRPFLKSTLLIKPSICRRESVFLIVFSFILLSGIIAMCKAIQGEGMAEQIMQTSALVFLVCVFAIKFHGDNDPKDWVKILETVPLILSSCVFLVSALFMIWQ